MSSFQKYHSHCSHSLTLLFPDVCVAGENLVLVISNLAWVMLIPLDKFPRIFYFCCLFICGLCILMRASEILLEGEKVKSLPPNPATNDCFITNVFKVFDMGAF